MLFFATRTKNKHMSDNWVSIHSNEKMKRTKRRMISQSKVSWQREKERQKSDWKKSEWSE